MLSQCIPNKTVKFNDEDPPWLNSQIKTAIKRKHRVYRKYLMHGRKLEDWNHVKIIRNKTSKMITAAKEQYYVKLGQKLSRSLADATTYWSVFNRILNKKAFVAIPPLLQNSIFVTNKKKKAAILNNYFLTQCCTIETSSSLSMLVPKCNVTIESLSIDPNKLLRLIRSLDPKESHGDDGISINMIKLCDESIIKPLCMIFKKFMETGVYPYAWKKSNVVPIHKKESRQLKNNYRPTSLLPIFGKLFEKLIFDAIYNHLCDHKLLVGNQSGFQPGDSTINQLLLITHKIYSGFEEIPCMETRAIFLDLSKAFNRVWHKGLIHKLQCNKICGNLLMLLQDFLHNRKQRVILNGQASECQPASSGVPQGSVLGPLLFIVYINDIVENVKYDIRLFADDTSLFSRVNDATQTVLKISEDLDKIEKWAWQWKMELKADKLKRLFSLLS